MNSRFAHQQREYDLHRYSPHRALLWQMRTGKSRAVVESAAALENALEINGVLVVAPNGVHRQWAEVQIPQWYEYKMAHAFSWRFSDPQNYKKFKDFMDRIIGINNLCLHWLCVNMEALIREEAQDAIRLFKRAVGPAMLVVDESHHFARPGAKRTAVARGLGRMFEYKRILTGTPIENSPFQAFSQFEILERAALGHTTYGGTNKKSKSRALCPTCGERCRGFKNEFGVFEMERRGGHMVTELTSYQNLDVLKSRMARYASVVLRKDCEDLPPLQCDRRIVEMTPTQQRWWNATRDKILDDIEELNQEKVFDGGAALVKLQQVEGGFWLRGDKKIERIIPLDDNPKMLILADEINWYDGQVIVWFEYLHEIDAALEFLSGEGITCGVFSGRAAKTRDRDLAAFMAGTVRVLLAQPRAGGEGRNMSAASKIVWYSHTFDAVTRSQANERATAMGGESVQIVDIVAPVGGYCLKLTDDKTELADDVSRNGLKAVLEGLR